MIYLDSAATSLQKPREVAEAVMAAVGRCGGPGRGTHAPAMLAADTLFACREEAASLFSVPDPGQVVFTMNATHALNLAVHSLISPGDRVVTTGWEHNAVTRPLRRKGARITAAVGPLFDADAFLASFEKALPGADAAVCTCVSNVFGFRLPYEEMARLCRRSGVPLILDAAQAAGHLPLDFKELGAAFVAMPGHKGLLGPQGTGILLCGAKTKPLLFGGTGTQSLRSDMPEELPDRLEAGTPNVCGVAGLLEGLRFLGRTGIDSIRFREEKLFDMLQKGLAELEHLHVFAAENRAQCGVISVIPERMDCETLAERLNGHAIAVRSGLHCAPMAHETEGTLDTGTVRFSLSLFNTEDEIRQTLKVLRKIL